MSHLLLGTAYSDTPYALLAIDEPTMIGNASALLAGDLDALGTLTRISAIMGLGTSFTETTHSGSMHEHMISHYIDMFAGDRHPRSSHGEQVGVATVTMSRLQNDVLTRDAPPELGATRDPRGAAAGEFRGGRRRQPDRAVAREGARREAGRRAQRAPRRRVADDPRAPSRRRAAVRDVARLDGRGRLPANGERARARHRVLPSEAVANARWIRDRFGMLDVTGDAVGDSVSLERFVETMPV